MIEGMSYRINSHSTSDDDSKYRRSVSPVEGYTDERAYWEARSPIMRFGRFLARKGWWSEEYEQELRTASRRRAIKALNDAEARSNPHIKHLFTDVFDKLPGHLKQQQSELKDHIARYSEHYAEIPLEQVKGL